MSLARRFAVSVCAFVFSTSVLAQAPTAPFGAVGEWPFIGGNIGGQRFSPLTAIDRSNVGRLKVAWTYHLRDFSTGD